MRPAEQRIRYATTFCAADHRRHAAHGVDNGSAPAAISYPKKPLRYFVTSVDSRDFHNRLGADAATDSSPSCVVAMMTPQSAVAATIVATLLVRLWFASWMGPATQSGCYLPDRRWRGDPRADGVGRPRV
jgi:hypothetical protein